MKALLRWVIVALVCVAVVIGANMLRQRQDAVPVVGPDVEAGDDSVSDRPDIETPSLAEALGVPEDDMVEVGGVMRPRRDVAGQEAVDLLAERDRYLKSLNSAGSTRDVAAETNEQTAALHAELKDKKMLAVRSALVSDEVFDRKAYLADPEPYLLKVRPGRSIRALEPGPDVVPLKSIGGLYREILQGEAAILEVKAEPGMPVTFHAQLGEFDNQLKTISVASSKDGIAKVVFKAVSGVQGNIKLTAASPVHSGRLSYLVKVATKN